MPHFVTYLGEILDEADTADEAEAIRLRLVDQIMADEVPHLLGPDDFEGRSDALDQIRTTFHQED